MILGKAKLTEFAGMPADYSSPAGQVNPMRRPCRHQGISVVLPGGSGSLLHPAGQNGLATVIPTVGLISRAGLMPITYSQATAGPMTRTVRDAAMLLNVLAAGDPLDPTIQRQRRPANLTADLAHDAMKGRANRSAQRPR